MDFSGVGGGCRECYETYSISELIDSNGKCRECGKLIDVKYTKTYRQYACSKTADGTHRPQIHEDKSEAAYCGICRISINLLDATKEQMQFWPVPDKSMERLREKRRRANPPIPRPKARILRASAASSKRVMRRLRSRRPKPLSPRCPVCGKVGKPGGICMHTQADMALYKSRQEIFEDKMLPDRDYKRKLYAKPLNRRP